MAIARFKDLCVDAGDPARLAAFWAAASGRTLETKDGSYLLTGPTPRHTIWVSKVPEAKTVKHRVHLDVYTRTLEELEALGDDSPTATPLDGHGRSRRRRVLRVPLREPDDDIGWHVLSDPEGNEFCAFTVV